MTDQPFRPPLCACLPDCLLSLSSALLRTHLPLPPPFSHDLVSPQPRVGFEAEERAEEERRAAVRGREEAERELEKAKAEIYALQVRRL